MMIPSEMPVISSLSQRPENGHTTGSYPDPSSLFSGTGGLGMFGQFGPDQMQMLQSLQQMGQQKQKEQVA